MDNKNQYVSYKWWEMIIMLVGAPFYFLHGLRRLCALICLLPVFLLSWTPIDFDVFCPVLRRLKEEKYDLKFKQRLILLIVGDMLWLIYSFSLM
mgnify:CR=1 FL=1|jgi:hypothetical protein